VTLKNCDICGLPSDSMVRGRCPACIISERGYRYRFFNLDRSNKIKAIIPSILAAALGYGLMAFANYVYWAGLIYEFGFFVLMLGLVSLPVVLFFGPIDW
jgi:hypothetical protein